MTDGYKIYLITTEADITEVENCIRKDTVIDEVIFWDNRAEAVQIDRITKEDSVIIAVQDKKKAATITCIILKKGVREQQICDFYGVLQVGLPFMRVDRVLANPYYDKYECLIFGLSHAEVGIIADNLCLPSANLAVSSQDLYYIRETFRYAINKYNEKLNNLKYIIIDMYKYNYFNFDVSMSKMESQYLILGGYNLDAHNFSKNPNFQCSYEELLLYILQKHYGDINDDKMKRWNKMFFVDFAKISSKRFDNIDWERRDQIADEETIQSYNYSPSNVRKHFYSTIEENTEILYDLLRMIRDYNHDIKVILMLMPMQAKAWELAKPYYEPWKDEFESILVKAKEKYDFEYLDWTCHPLSADMNNWYDAEHLNYIGALRFTECINKLIRGN